MQTSVETGKKEDIDAKNDSIDCRCIDSRQDGSGCIGRIRTDDPGQGDDAQEAGNETAGIKIIRIFRFLNSGSAKIAWISPNGP